MSLQTTIKFEVLILIKFMVDHLAQYYDDGLRTQLSLLYQLSLWFKSSLIQYIQVFAN